MWYKTEDPSTITNSKIKTIIVFVSPKLGTNLRFRSHCSLRSKPSDPGNTFGCCVKDDFEILTAEKNHLVVLMFI